MCDGVGVEWVRGFGWEEGLVLFLQMKNKIIGRAGPWDFWECVWCDEVETLCLW